MENGVTAASPSTLPTAIGATVFRIVCVTFRITFQNP